MKKLNGMVVAPWRCWAIRRRSDGRLADIVFGTRRAARVWLRRNNRKRLYRAIRVVLALPSKRARR